MREVFQNPADAFPTGPPAVGEEGDLDDGRVALSVFGAEGGFGMRKPFGFWTGGLPQAPAPVKPPDLVALIAPLPDAIIPDQSEA